MKCPQCNAQLVLPHENAEVTTCPCGWSGYLDNLPPNGDADWLQYEKLIKKMANQYYYKGDRRVELEDYVGQGRLAYAEALTTWDPAKGAFTTHLTWVMRKHLVKLQRDSYHFYRNCTELGLKDEDEASGFMASLLDCLSNDAVELVHHLLQQPLSLRHRNTLPGSRDKRLVKEVRMALRSLTHA